VVDTPTKRKRTFAESFPLARTLAFYCFKVEIKNSKTERERGFIEKRIQKNSRETRDEEELLLLLLLNEK
jgi:hypothetical protein